MNNKLNYPTWLVPLEIAQELKVIGFDVPCHFHFLYYHGWEMLKKRGDEYGFITSNSCRAYVVENHNAIGKLSVPTWEQVFQWFRDKGFMITLINYEDVSKFSFYNMKIRGGVYYAEAFKTYEQAREELVYKLIEIYKS